MRKFKIRGQYLSEFALCLVLVSAALFTLRLYLVRAFQAKYKAGTDYLFSEMKEEALKKNKSLKPNTQYEPYYVQSETTETKEVKSSDGFPERSREQRVITSSQREIGVPGEAD